MTEQEIGATLQYVGNQRNIASNECAVFYGKNVALTAENEALKATVLALEEQLKKKGAKGKRKAKK